MYDFLLAVAAVITALVAASLPLLKILRGWSDNKVANAVNGAEGMFYTHLAEQLRTNTEALTQAYSERNVLVEKYARMEVRLTQLEAVERNAAEGLATLTRKLDERETEIRRLIALNERHVEELNQKNNLIITQNAEIAGLTERIHQLELRLGRDESRWTEQA